MISTVMTQEVQRGRETFYIVQGCVEGHVAFTGITELRAAVECIHAEMVRSYAGDQDFEKFREMVQFIEEEYEDEDE
jgi:hypothetical protein